MTPSPASPSSSPTMSSSLSPTSVFSRSCLTCTLRAWTTRSYWSAMYQWCQLYGVFIPFEIWESIIKDDVCVPLWCGNAHFQSFVIKKIRLTLKVSVIHPSTFSECLRRNDLRRRQGICLAVSSDQSLQFFPTCTGRLAFKRSWTRGSCDVKMINYFRRIASTKPNGKQMNQMITSIASNPSATCSAQLQSPCPW